MANTIARLGVRLGIDSAEFTKGIEAAKKELSTFATAASGYATVASAAFAAMTVKALQYADSIADVAKANDVAISTVLQLSSALQQNGGNAENASKMLSAFTAFVDKAASGSFEAQKAFQDVGVSLKDIGTMDMESLMAKTLSGLNKMPDTLTRNARAMDFFSKAAKGVDIAGLADDMGKASAITEKQTKAVEDAAKAWDLLEKASKEAMLTFTTFVGTPMLKMVEYLTELPKLVDKARIAYENMGNTISFVNRLQAAVIMRDTDSLKKLVEDYYKIKNTIDLGKFDGGGDSYDNPASVTSAKDTSEKRKTKLGVDPEAAKAEALRLQQLQFNIRQRQREGKEIEENTKRMVEQFATEVLRQDAYAKTLKDRQTEFELDVAGKQMREEDVRLAKDLLQIESNRAEKIRDIKLNNDLLLASQRQLVESEDELNKLNEIHFHAQEQLIDRENQLANEAERLARARNDISRSIREGTLEQGFGLAMEDYFRNAATAMERGQQIFTSVIGNMGAAIDNFVRTGKFAFKDFARSIIQDIISIQLRAQATQLLGMAFSGFGGKYTPGSNSFVGPMPQGFADGGSPPVGVASLVGERGPELFIPRTAGTIIPNNSLASAMGGGQTVNYNGPFIANMSAIDTQSATQFLAKNKQTIWAVNQSAQRSLPVSK
jgi:lambda family phage tail tape measure protein